MHNDFISFNSQTDINMFRYVARQMTLMYSKIDRQIEDLQKDRQIDRIDLQKDRQIDRIDLQKDRQIDRIDLQKDRQIDRIDVQKDRQN